MADSTANDSIEMVNHGWRVTMAGLGINLALGVLYSWSVISAEIGKADWGADWTATEKSLPYRVACLVFCLIMVPAGRMQDKLSPRLVASIGGVLVGAGMILASQFQTVMGYVIGFGVLAGAGIGFGYASATPPAVKWFPPAKTGMIAGIVVSGFGLASVYTSFLCKWLAKTWDLQVMMMSLGIGFLIVVVGLAQFLKAPHRAAQMIKGLGNVGAQKKQIQSGGEEHGKDYSPVEMMKTVQFWMLWFMYACGAGAGLMVISVCKKINASAGLSEAMAITAVAAMGIGNGGGRVIAGTLSDKIGRNRTMLLFFLLQAGAIAGLIYASSHGAGLPVLLSLTALVGANYGSNLALFPSATKDYYGLKNFGVNYGLVFTAWGIGGYVLSLLASSVYDKNQSYGFAFYTSAALLVAAGVMTFIVRPPRKV